jgi:hypothetical protein
MMHGKKNIKLNFISVLRTCRKLAAKGFKIENAGSINNLTSAYVSSNK